MKAMAVAVYLCRTDVTAPSCPPRPPTPPWPRSPQWLGPIAARPLAECHRGTSVKTISSRHWRTVNDTQRPPPAFPPAPCFQPPPSGFLMREIPFILSSAHFNKPPQDVLPPPPHPEEVMKGDWLISGTGAMPQAWQTDWNNTLLHAGSDPISDV